MPIPNAKKKAERDLAEGKSPSTAAGAFVREEIREIREGKHGARNTKQAIAIGLSKARRAGVPAKPSTNASGQIKKKAAQDMARAGKRPNPKRSSASAQARKREPRTAASFESLSEHAKDSAARRRHMGGRNAPTAVASRAAKTRKRRQAPSAEN